MRRLGKLATLINKKGKETKKAVQTVLAFI